MDHGRLDDIVQHRIDRGIWEFGTDQGVYVFRVPQLVFFVQDEEQVHVGKTSLLKFDDVDVGDRDAQNVLLRNVVQQFFLLDVEDSCDYIWTVLRLLSRLEVLRYFRPPGIAGQGEEDVRFAVVSHDGHGVLIVLVHIPRTADEGRRQNHGHTSPHTSSLGSSVHVVCQTHVVVDPQLFLVVPDVSKPVSFDLDVCVDQVLLEQLLAVEDGIEEITTHRNSVAVEHQLRDTLHFG